MALTAGTRFGPYEVVGLLGAGGMGEVYRARDPRLDRDVALKVLPGHLAGDQEALARFNREARAVAALAHPNIVVLHDCGKEEGVFFVVMELLPGESLRKRLARGPVPWPQALELGIELSEGLFAAHAKGIVHRDLKPENIFLTPEGRVKILDFGLARLDGRGEPPLPAPGPAAVPNTEMDPGAAATAKVESTSIAETVVRRPDGQSTLMGTVGYMSPEHVRGEVVDARTDIFSLGCVLYEMITGVRAFHGKTHADTLHAVLTTDPPAAFVVNTETPEAVSCVIQRCLAKNAAERYASAREVARDLREILAEQFKPRASLKLLVSAWTLGILLVVALILGFYILHRTPTQSGPIDSIAVLPLTSVGGEQRGEYLSDGLTDSLIHSLSRASELRVLSRTAVQRFHGPDVNPHVAGDQLGVRAVLVGKVMLQGEQVTITVELIDVRDQRTLWGDRFVRRVADLPTIERDIAASITSTLRVKLSGAQQERLAKRATEDAAAYELYLKGRFFWNKRSEEALTKAIDCFRQAVERDSGFSLAHAGLADSYCTMGSYGYVPPEQAFPKAEAAARRALELDAELAEPRAALALVRELYIGDLPGALAEYERALHSNPNYATAHQWYAFCLAENNRLEEAKAAIRRAQELEPLSLSINSGHGWILYLARDYDAAESQLQKTLDMEPTFVAAVSSLGLVRAAKGDAPGAIVLLQKARALAPGDAEPLAYCGYLLAQAGRIDEARLALRDLDALSKQRHVPRYHVALIHVALGETDRAFAELEAAFRERSCALASIKVVPLLDPLRKDPRFVELVRRIELPP